MTNNSALFFPEVYTPVGEELKQASEDFARRLEEFERELEKRKAEAVANSETAAA